MSSNVELYFNTIKLIFTSLNQISANTATKKQFFKLWSMTQYRLIECTVTPVQLFQHFSLDFLYIFSQNGRENKGEINVLPKIREASFSLDLGLLTFLPLPFFLKKLLELAATYVRDWDAASKTWVTDLNLCFSDFSDSLNSIPFRENSFLCAV